MFKELLCLFYLMDIFILILKLLTKTLLYLVLKFYIIFEVRLSEEGCFVYIIIYNRNYASTTNILTQSTKSSQQYTDIKDIFNHVFGLRRPI